MMVKGAKWISDELFVLALPYPVITDGKFFILSMFATATFGRQIGWISNAVSTEWDSSIIATS